MSIPKKAHAAVLFSGGTDSTLAAAQMLEELGVRSVRVLTNNPKKLEGLRRHGVRVTGRQPLQMSPNEHNVAYLATKKQKSGHLL